MCAAQASSSPPPITAPFSAAITGMRLYWIRSNTRCHIWECRRPSVASCSVSSDRSRPEEKWSPTPWMTTAPTPSGRLEKQSWIARMMPSFSALRLAGRLRPTVSTAPDCSILSNPDWAAGAAAFPIGFYCFLSRIVIFYNYWRESQEGHRNCLGPALAPIAVILRAGGGYSTPPLLDSILGVSGILGHPHALVTATEY